jgi:competence protein ComFC
MRTFKNLRTLSDYALRFLVPWACAGCRIPLETLTDAGFCGICWLKIPRISGCVCRHCGVPLKDGGNLCYSCRQTPVKIVVRAAGTYAGPLAQAIQRFKYAGRKSLAIPFGPLLSYAWDQYPELAPIDALIPVPLHPSNLYDRGYNQAQLLAERLSQAIGQPVLNNVLTRVRKTSSQTHLSKTDRLLNLERAFDIAENHSLPVIKGLSLLLIDDVCTTSTTLTECARVLRKAGARQVKALVLAKDT